MTAGAHSEARLENLALRSDVLAAVRDWFHGQGYIEVETPVRLPAPALEAHIDAEPSGACYLRTSPELYHKRLLAEGVEKLFELGPCFRAGERGPRHNPEYTMLEWYRVGCDYRDMLAETRALLLHVCRAVLPDDAVVCDDQRSRLTAPWVETTVSESFRRQAGWDPLTAFDEDRFDGRGPPRRVVEGRAREGPDAARPRSRSGREGAAAAGFRRPSRAR